MNRIYVKPSETATVFHPNTNHIIPSGGAEVDFCKPISRSIACGDLIKCKAPVPEKKSMSKNANKNYQDNLI